MGGRRGGRQSGYVLRLEPEGDVRQLALELAGLLPGLQERPRRTFGDVGADWLSRLVRVRPDNEERHLWQLWPLWELRDAGAEEREDDLTKARIETCLRALDKEHGGTLGPSSLNKLLSTGKLVVDDAIANRRWRSANPFDFVPRRRVPRKPWPRITADELARALAQLRPDRQRECIWQIHSGMRPGETRALKASDVDLERGFVSVERSNDRSTTKTGRSRELPIPAGARAVLEVALRLSPSEFVFPNPDGSQQRADAKLSRVLQAAFERAGIDKHVTWYQLRHASCSLHREAGADALAVKQALGHAARDIQDDVYAHLSDKRFALEMSKLVVRPKGPTFPVGHGGNRSPLNQYIEAIRGLVAEHPDLTDDEIAVHVRRTFGIDTSRSAVQRFVRRHGLRQR